MKNKITRTLTALCAALMLMGGFSVTAFAQTPTTEETDDSGVIVETEPQPLTPEGNMTQMCIRDRYRTVYGRAFCRLAPEVSGNVHTGGRSERRHCHRPVLWKRHHRACRKKP